MYYYIFDPPQGPKEYERTAQIKEHLSQLGIAGEMAAPQPGRSAEDLVQLAIAKRYSTIVTVGGMELINRVARALMPHDAVLGIIPVNPDPDIAALIGTNDWKQAADQLKRRRWQHLELGVMNGSICFLTPATINIPKSATVTITTDTFMLETAGPVELRVSPAHAESAAVGLDLQIKAEQPGGSIFKLFSGKNQAPLESQFRVGTLSVRASASFPVIVAGEELARTPVACSTEQRGIRLIVGKAAGS